MTNWKYKIDLGRAHDPDDGNFSEHRDRTVRVIRKSRWARESQFSWTLTDYVSELTAAPDIDTFDTVMDSIYDLADTDRCWIEVALW